MPPEIALQLYTLRDLIARDFEGMIGQIAEIGYPAVETIGFSGALTPDKMGKTIHRAGLRVVSAHAPLPLDGRKYQVLDALAALDCSHLVCGWVDPGNYGSPSAIQKIADLFNQAGEVANAAGLRFSVHNHWFEFETVDGVPAYHILMEHLSPTVLFEIDTYWVKTAGADPAQVLAELGPRAPLVHVKDGPADHPDSPMVAVGRGTLDFSEILPAGAPHTEAHIVELDRCETDMMAAVRESYAYLTENGLSSGFKV
jgi:sugar phosphate isomerase/epimerase